MTEGNNMVDPIDTSDLYFAAFLHAIGCKIQGTRAEGPQTHFIFEVTEERGNLKQIYFNNDKDSAVPAQTLCNSIKALKTMCFVKGGNKSKSNRHSDNY